MPGNKPPKAPSGQVLEFSGAHLEERRQSRREAKARDLRQRFSAARQDAEPRSKATRRLLNLFKQPGPKNR